MSKKAITPAIAIVATITAIYLAGRAWAEPLIDPADIVISDLVVSPLEVFVGEHVSISATVTNIGGERGSYIVQLGGDFMAQKTVTLNAGESKPVTFQVVPDEVRWYGVSVEQLTGGFNVVEEPGVPNIVVSDLVIEPTHPYVGETVTISVIATNIGNASGSKVITLQVV